MKAMINELELRLSVGRARRCRPRPGTRGIPPIRLDRRRPRASRVVRRRGGPARAGRRRSTGTATSGRGGAIPTRAGQGVVTGSHLDSVPTAVPSTARSVSCPPSPRSTRCAPTASRPARPIGVVNFVDEEGARFGVACAGSRLLTGALAPEQALGLRDADGVSMGRGAPAGPASTGDISAATRKPWPASARSSNCTSSRAAQLIELERPSASARASGRTGAGASTCPARPTTPARPGSRIATTRCSASPAWC